MGIENMRRWPMYIVFALCILLVLSLFNSWSRETETMNKLVELSRQMQECSKQKSTCMEESLNLVEQRDEYLNKVNDLNQLKVKLTDDVADFKSKADKSMNQVNRTLVDVELCKTELQSLKNLQLSKSVTLETLRLEKDTLTAQLTERKERIDQLEKEVATLKAAMTTKAASNAVPSKVTPAQPLKRSPALNPHNPINEPAIDTKEENDAKEDIEDANVMNDANEFDPQV